MPEDFDIDQFFADDADSDPPELTGLFQRLRKPTGAEGAFSRKQKDYIRIRLQAMMGDEQAWRSRESAGLTRDLDAFPTDDPPAEVESPAEGGSSSEHSGPRGLGSGSRFEDPSGLLLRVGAAWSFVSPRPLAARPPTPDTPLAALIIEASPARHHLPQASAEARAVREAFCRAGMRAHVQQGGGLAATRELMAKEQPRFVIFVGHADAKHPKTGELTLGLIDDEGGLVLMLPDTVINILGGASSKLQLISLNGCESGDMCETLYRRFKVPVVGWRTIVNDDAAKKSSVAFWEHLTTRQPLESDDDVCAAVRSAFDQGVWAVQAMSVRNSTQSAGLSSDKYAVADPRTTGGPTMGRLLDGRWAAGVPIVLVPLPAHKKRNLPALDERTYVPRPALQAALREKLVPQSVTFLTGRRVSGGGADTLLSLEGIAGVGKTQSLTWLVNDIHVQSAFPDGVFWLVLGNEAPNAHARMSDLARYLELRLEKRLFGNEADAIESLKAAVADSRCLVILDDVWTHDHVRPFVDACGPNQVLVLSTRNTHLAEGYSASSVPVDLLDQNDAITMLGNYLCPQQPADQLAATAADLVEYCYRLPIAIRSVTGLMNQSKLSVLGALKYLKEAETRLERLDQYKDLDKGRLGGGRKSLFVSLFASLEKLGETHRQRCCMLAIFLEDDAIPFGILGDLWGEEPMATLRELAKWKLVEMDGDKQVVRLLDLHLQYLRCCAKSDLGGWHAKLLAACSATEVGGDEGASGGYWDEYEGGRRFMHHVRGCHGGGAPTRLATLKLTGVGIDNAGVEALANLLKSNETISLLRLAGNSLGGHHTAQGDFVPDLSGVTALAEALKQSSTLTTLGLRGCSLGTEGAREIAAALGSNSSLKHFDLAVNNIGAEGARHLAQALEVNSSLQCLGLSYNQLGPEGAQLIAAALENSALERLDLGRNDIDPEGAKHLAEALKANSTIQRLGVQHNNLNSAAKQLLRNVAEGKRFELLLYM